MINLFILNFVKKNYNDIEKYNKNKFQNNNY